MSEQNFEQDPLTNGRGAAAILAAGFGSMTLGLCSAASDLFPRAKQIFQFYPRSGPLSGVSTVAVAVWIICWLFLNFQWKRRTVAFGRINLLAFLLLSVGLLLTFPPFVDLL